GVPAGTHVLRAELAGRRVTISAGIRVTGNVVGAVVPLFTDAQIDSVLAARGAPDWCRGAGLLGGFALRSSGVPLGDATVPWRPGPPVEGATVSVLAGATAAQTTTTSLGQFSLVGMKSDRYVLEITKSGFVPGATWPQPVDVDTTLSEVIFEPDSLSAWSAAG